ncbi:MAG: GGDEF domain-containing protein [Geodermatophilaceae bacterium]|nr:GGDEF domain-containing protein [Geodermatophilaceae bacterium]
MISGSGPEATEEFISSAVAGAAVAAAKRAAQAVIETQAAVSAAARTVAESSAEAARTVAVSAAEAAQALAAAVEATAVVTAAAAAAAAAARRTEAWLTHAILHDDLTGLVNRRLLIDRLSQALARSSRAGTTVAVLFLDLDGFKTVNDTLGHAIGDQLLMGVAGRLTECLRDTDTCARVGGDEFIIVCEDLTHPEGAQLLASRLQTTLAAGVPVGGRTLPVPVSVGIAVSSAGSRPLDLIDEADRAMYRVKGADRELDPRTGRPRIAEPAHHR